MSTVTMTDYDKVQRCQRPAAETPSLLSPPTITYPGKLTGADGEHGPRKISGALIAEDDAATVGMSPITLNELIAELGRIFAVEKVDIDEVKRVMQRYRSNRADWTRFAKFDPHRYTRNLVDVGNGKYNLMLLAWGENQGSSIHDHANAHCFMKILDGELHELRYNFPDRAGSPPRKAYEDILKRNDVCYINDSIGLHRVENPSHTDKAVSLHLYIPPFEECHTFDERTGKVNTCRVTFWSQYGERTPFQAAGARCTGNSDQTAAVPAGTAAVEDDKQAKPPVFAETVNELL